ncbi:MAG: MBOAT family protein, partial [Chitinophagaceae bacterium]
GWLYKGIAIIITFHFVCFGWVFFKAEDFDSATTMLYQVGNDLHFSVWPAFFKNYQTVLYMMLLAYILHSIPDSFADKMIGKMHRAPMIAYLVIFFAFVLLYGYFKSAEPVQPIYLQF